MAQPHSDNATAIEVLTESDRSLTKKIRIHVSQVTSEKNFKNKNIKSTLTAILIYFNRRLLSDFLPPNYRIREFLSTYIQKKRLRSERSLCEIFADKSREFSVRGNAQELKRFFYAAYNFLLYLIENRLFHVFV